MSVIDINSNTGSLDYNTPSSWSETLLGACLFLIYPFTLATDVLIGWIVTPLHLPQPMLETIGLTYRLLEMALLLLVWILGWVRNFPRWSFAWIGFSVFFTLLYTSMPLPGSRDLIGWWIGLPWVIALGIALFLTRSFRPLEQLARDVWNDWTRLSLAFYGITPLLLLFALFDEVKGKELFVTGLALVLSLGALAYLRSAEVWQRISSLLVTHALVWGAATLYLASYWSVPNEHGLSWVEPWDKTLIKMTQANVFFTLFLCAPLLLGLVRNGIRWMRHT